MPRFRRSATAVLFAGTLALAGVACEDDGTGIDDDVEQEIEEDAENLGDSIEEETDGEADSG